MPTVRYVYDNEDILFEFDGSNTLKAHFTHGAGIDEPLVMERDLDSSGTFTANERFFYHTDGLGSIVDLTDSTGSTIQSYVYDSFGQILQQNGTLTNPYTYTGREYDSESGLYFYQQRFYDPGVGRFLQEDPVGFLDSTNLFSYVDSVGKPLSYFKPVNEINPYLYTANNPVNYVDPYGEYAIEYVIIIGLTVVGIKVTYDTVRSYIDYLKRSIQGNINPEELYKEEIDNLSSPLLRFSDFQKFLKKLNNVCPINSK